MPIADKTLRLEVMPSKEDISAQLAMKFHGFCVQDVAQRRELAEWIQTLIYVQVSTAVATLKKYEREELPGGNQTLKG